MAKVAIKATTHAVFNGKAVYARIYDRAVAGVRESAEDMEKIALKLVPVRKVFREGRKNVHSRVFAEQRIQGRQETRPLSLEEALAESVTRRRLGLASAFPETTTGRRIPRSQPLVRTATSTDGSRTFHRANRGGPDENREVFRINGQNRLVTLTEVFDDRGFSLGHRPEVDVAAERRLSARGRSELRRSTGSQLGGALKRSIELHEPVLTRNRITQYVTAGDEDAPYAKYVEFGTRRSRAQPFMRPAKAQARESYPGLLKRHLQGVVKGRR